MSSPTGIPRMGSLDGHFAFKRMVARINFQGRKGSVLSIIAIEVGWRSRDTRSSVLLALTILGRLMAFLDPQVPIVASHRYKWGNLNAWQ